MIGSQVRALVRPPPSLRVWTFASNLAVGAQESGILAFGASLDWVSANGSPIFAGLSPRRKLPFPAQAETGSLTGWRVRSSRPINSPPRPRKPPGSAMSDGAAARHKALAGTNQLRSIRVIGGWLQIVAGYVDLTSRSYCGVARSARCVRPFQLTVSRSPSMRFSALLRQFGV
jgi:hypothetical protein